MDLEKYISIKDNTIQPEMISSIIKWCNKSSSFEPGKVGYGDIEKDIRNVELLNLLNWEDKSKTKIHWANFLHFLLKENFMNYSKEKFLLKNEFIVNGIDDISILRYYEGGKYVTHVDHSRAVPRTLSAILLLNNEYEGGELKFFYPCGKLMKEVKPALGRLIIWPSNFLYPHAVEPIRRGIRYSIVSWAQ